MIEIIIIRGPLGVGKTTIARGLAEALSAEYISIDTILAENKLDQGEDIPLKNFLKANEILIPKIKVAHKNKKSVVIDGNFYFKETIEDLENKLNLPLKIFYLTAPLDICLARDAAREDSLGQLATRAVYNLVSRVDIGTKIKANEKNTEEIIEDIKKYLKI